MLGQAMRAVDGATAMQPPMPRLTPTLVGSRPQLADGVTGITDVAGVLA